MRGRRLSRPVRRVAPPGDISVGISGRHIRLAYPAGKNRDDPPGRIALYIALAAAPGARFRSRPVAGGDPVGARQGAPLGAGEVDQRLWTLPPPPVSFSRVAIGWEPCWAEAGWLWSSTASMSG
jgi:hypothetical protein